MSAFYDRFAGARRAEEAVKTELAQRGWLACDFGQAQIPEAGRNILKRYEDSSLRPTLLRWMPDIIALRDTARPEVVLVEAKICAPEMQNYAIETRSVESAEIFINHAHVPVFFVCVDDHPRVLTPRDIRERGVPGKPPRSGRGSGAPYWLVAKEYGRPFDAIFGSAA